MHYLFQKTLSSHLANSIPDDVITLSYKICVLGHANLIHIFYIFKRLHDKLGHANLIQF